MILLNAAWRIDYTGHGGNRDQRDAILMAHINNVGSFKQDVNCSTGKELVK